MDISAVELPPSPQLLTWVEIMPSSTDGTIWSTTPTDLGLTETQWQKEQMWIQQFTDVTDELDWDKWQHYWTEGRLSHFLRELRQT